MDYSNLPGIYKMFVKESDLLEFYDRDWYEREELDEEGHDIVAEFLSARFEPVIKSVNLDGPDDFMLSAYLEAGPWNSSKNKDKTVTMKIQGSFQFCVYGCKQYGRNAYKILKRVLESNKFSQFTISDLYQPENTPGISFNGIYQDEDTIYIGGQYEFTPATVDVIIPKTKKFLVDVRPYDSGDYVGLKMKINAPKNSSDEDLKQIIVDKYEDKLLSKTKFKSVEFKKYEDDYIECKVKITFDNYPYTIYVDNMGGIPLKYNDETSARECAWQQFLEDLEVEDVSFLES